MFQLKPDSYFNPLPPHGGRLHGFRPPVNTIEISIHSLRMEGDYCAVYPVAPGNHFNPLPPHGGRPAQKVGDDMAHGISIHSLRMEGDFFGIHSPSLVMEFQSTPSAWRETYMRLGDSFIDSAFQSTPSAWRETSIYQKEAMRTAFQSTPSAWRETRGTVHLQSAGSISIHSLRMEGDPDSSSTHSGSSHFNPLPPHGGRHPTPSWRNRIA